MRESGFLRGVPLGEGVVSNGVRTRGKPPPPFKQRSILKHGVFAPKRGFFALKIVSYWNKMGVFGVWHGFCLRIGVKITAYTGFKNLKIGDSK